MQESDALGHVEFAVLDAVQRGLLRPRCSAQQIAFLRRMPAGEPLLHDALRRCEHDRLLRSWRDGTGRQYELTAAGRTRLRADRRFRLALGCLLVRGSAEPF
jgi:hypothetical protein